MMSRDGMTLLQVGAAALVWAVFFAVAIRKALEDCDRTAEVDAQERLTDLAIGAMATGVGRMRARQCPGCGTLIERHAVASHARRCVPLREYVVGLN